MNAPAILIAIPLMVGVLAGVSAGDARAATLAAVGLAWAIAAIALWRRWNRLFALACCAGCCASGIAIGAAAARWAAEPTLLTWFARNPPDRPARLIGILRADAATTTTATSVVVDATTVDGQAVEGGIRLSIAGAFAAGAAPSWRAGRTISVDVTPREPLDYRDPGVPSDRIRLARQGIVLLGSVKSAALVTLVKRGTLLDETAAALRARVRDATALAVGRWSPKSAGVVTAILIGDRTGLDAEDERRLQEAGTYHVIAISGGNIALLTALLVGCGRAARLPVRTTAAASVGLLAFYGYAAGLAPSVLRATVAGMIYLAARAVDHRGGALNAIAVAAAFAAVGAPLTVLDPGFVLSFGATFAIIVSADRIAPRPATSRRDHASGRLQRLARTGGNALLALGVATLCAEIALAPVGARLFGRVSFAGLFLNFAAIPLMSIIQVAGLLAVAVSPISATLAAAAGWVAHAGTVALLGSASVVDAAPWLVVDLPSPTWMLIVAWYAGCAGLLFIERLRWRALGAAVAVIAGGTMLESPPLVRATQVPAAPAGWTRIVFLDVGQGDAALVQPPNSAPILVDAGGVPGTAFDLGRRVTLPAVWAFGVSRLGALVLSHGDPDHIGGAPPLLRALSPHEIWDGIPVPSHLPLQHLRELAQRAGIPWIERRAGESLSAGSLRIGVLSPPMPTWERQRVRNDDSVVLEARIGDVAFLLPGDISQAAERDVVPSFEPAPIVIVKAPHHGSAGSSSQAMIDALRPAAVIFSAGKRNPFGHPAPAVVDRYRGAGAQIFSTADDGAVVVDTDGKQVVVWTWMGRRVLLNTARADGSAQGSRRH